MPKQHNIDKKSHVAECEHFLKGTCKFGTKCTKRHVQESVQKLTKQPKVPLKRTMLIPQVVRQISQLAEKKKSTLIEQKRFNDRYVMVTAAKDEKSGVPLDDPYKDRLQLIDNEIQIIRAGVRSAFGTKLLKFRMPTLYSISSSGAGVLNTVVNVDPSGEPEFASLATLFDEYRVVGGVVDFNSASFITAAVGQVSYTVMGFDPVTAAATGSALAIAQMEQHVVVYPTMYVNTAAYHAYIADKPHKFAYRVSPEVIEINVANASIGGAWHSTTAAAYFPYGYIHNYGNGLIVSVPAYTGFHTYHLEFRCRT